MRYSFPALILLASLAVFVGCADRFSPGSTAPAVTAGEAVKTETGGGGSPTVASGAAATDAQVNLQVLDWDGLQELLARHRGKVVVLDCWSTSCAPCIKEFPNLVALHNRHAPSELACVSLSFDYEGIGRPEDEHSRVLAFLQEHRATFDNVLSRLDSDALTEKLEIPSIPAVFVYDRAGRLQRRFDNRHASRDGGPFTYEQVSEVVEQLLAEPAVGAE
jgi:thiol-disulfide isomerase/thioredoxin